MMESKNEIIVKEEPLWMEHSTNIKTESEGHSIYYACLENNIMGEDQDSNMAPYDALALEAKSEIKEEIMCSQDDIKSKDYISWEEHTQKRILTTDYPILYAETKYVHGVDKSTVFSSANLENRECLKIKCNPPETKITDIELEKNEPNDASAVENNNHSFFSEQQCKCEVCGKEYMRHNLNNDNSSLKCEVCIKNSLSTSSSGVKNVFPKSKKQRICEVCGKHFSKVSHLKEHVYTHVGYRPHVCKVCEKGFIKPSDLKRHVLIHEDKKLNKCEHCGQTFALLCQLGSHISCHDHKRYMCESCGKCFTKISHLKDHVLIHGGYRPHSCKICKRSFTRLSDLKRHNLIHEGVKPHKCDICGKSFMLTSQLKKHNLIHERK